MAAFDGALRTDLDAGLAFPALLGPLIVRLHRMTGFRTVFVQLHQIAALDVRMQACLIQTLAAITFVGKNKCGHITRRLSLLKDLT